MKNGFLKEALWPLIVLALVLWIGFAAEAVLPATKLMHYLEPARRFWSEQPVLAVALFCLAHLISSLFSLPGSCTFLNITAGALFGFWAGCAIVYPVTLLSACISYWAARRLSGLNLLRRYEKTADAVRRRAREQDVLFFISVRLSPFLPFGILNVVFGLLHVPFRIYFLTTLFGIFFDVTLLNSLGATLRATGTSSGPNQKSLAITFLVLCLIFLVMCGWFRVTAAAAHSEKA